MDASNHVVQQIMGWLERGLVREYPNKPSMTLSAASDLVPPRVATPIFFGAFDWHSAVHGHWALLRIWRHWGVEVLPTACVEGLEERINPSAVAAELAYFLRPEHRGFEMPYGVAWHLMVDAELAFDIDPRWGLWRRCLAPLVELARDRFLDWMSGLEWPIRGGQHSQSAFAMSLAWIWASVTQRDEEQAAIWDKALRFYEADNRAPWAYEPSAYDFLSPCLSEAYLMAQVMPRKRFCVWWNGFVEDETKPLAMLTPVSCPDHADGKQVHLDGLNMSRAWMLQGIASTLGEGHADVPALNHMAEKHWQHGEASFRQQGFAVSHWLGTFWLFGRTHGNL